MKFLKSKEFWEAAAHRAIRTFCQVFVSSIPTSAAIIQDVNWAFILSASGLAAIISIVTSIATGLPEVEEE
jgi:hypothetical protein